jgi:hypothetical protein
MRTGAFVRFGYAVCASESLRGALCEHNAGAGPWPASRRTSRGRGCTVRRCILAFSRRDAGWASPPPRASGATSRLRPAHPRRSLPASAPAPRSHRNAAPPARRQHPNQADGARSGCSAASGPDFAASACSHRTTGRHRRQRRHRGHRGESTSSELDAVATRFPSASVTVPSANTTRRPSFVTVPVPVSGPVSSVTGRR